MIEFFKLYIKCYYHKAAMFHCSTRPFPPSFRELSPFLSLVHFSIISFKGGKYTVSNRDLFSSVGVKSKGAGQHFSAKIKPSNIQIRMVEDSKITSTLLNVGVGYGLLNRVQITLYL